MGREEIRIVALGDELLAGVGDAKALGWVGRVVARTPQEECRISLYPLPVPAESTADLTQRWWPESSRRYGDGTADCRLLIGLGHADAFAGLSVPRARLNLANVLDDAHSRRLPAFVVGPPPIADPQVNRAVQELSRTYGDVCRRRDVPFVDTHTPLAAHETWLTDLAGGDGLRPQQAGYGLIAWLVLHNGWYDWLGLPRP